VYVCVCVCMCVHVCVQIITFHNIENGLLKFPDSPPVCVYGCVNVQMSLPVCVGIVYVVMCVYMPVCAAFVFVRIYTCVFVLVLCR